MTDITEQYFSLNRMLLLILGVWPYKQSKLDRLRFIIILAILITAVFFQFTAFLTSKCTVDFVIQVLTNALFFVIITMQYIFFAFNTETVKDLLTQFQHVYDQLKNKYESAIIDTYSYSAKRYTIVFTTLYICSMSGVFVVQLLWGITGGFVTTNLTHHFTIKTEYFIDPEKYVLLIMLHWNVLICIGAGVLVATGTMLLVYIILICGLFKVASYRIEHAMRVNMLENITPEKDILILKEIICAVDIHRQAMKLSKLLVSRFEAMLFCFITIGVVMLSLNIFQIFRILSVGFNLEQIFNYSLNIFVTILYMFCANYLAQQLTDHNKYIFIAAYNVQWYIAPLHIQKLILFLLQRSVQEFTIDIGGLFVGSLKCFATLVKTSVSYFTVIYSTQE